MTTLKCPPPDGNPVYNQLNDQTFPVFNGKKLVAKDEE